MRRAPILVYPPPRGAAAHRSLSGEAGGLAARERPSTVVMSGAPVVDAQAFFDAIARRYDRSYALDASSTRVRMRRVLRELRPSSRVLDLGVGTGRELSALQDAGHEVVGLEVSRNMIEICARRTRPIEIVRGDLWGALPFPAATFDAVLALHGTLAHPPEGERSLRGLAAELTRLLRASAASVVVAEVPSPGWLDALDRGRDHHLPAQRVGTSESMRCVHEDRAACVAIEATVYSPASWSDLWGTMFAVSIEAISDVEQLVIGRPVAF